MKLIKENQERLDELRLVYEDILQKCLRWEDLQTVEAARVEYEALTAQEERKLTDLKQRKHDLEEEKRRLIVPETDSEALFFPTKAAGHWQLSQRKARTHKDVAGSDKMAVRHRLKKFVNRWAYSWRLDITILGQVNRIADDVDRPLGEALALLDWSMFVDHTHTRESPEMYFLRLAEWGEALVEYRDVLIGNINALETRFQRWLPIWERWRLRDQSEQARADWIDFIRASRQVKQDQITLVEHEITHLTETISQLRAYLGERI